MIPEVKTETEVKIENKTGLLTKVLRADGVFALLTGAIMTAGAGPIAELFDLSQSAAFIALGLVLLGYGGGLLYYAGRQPENRLVAKAAIVLNLLWVLGSYMGLLLGWFPVNTAGKWAIALVAEVIFIFALAELYAIRREKPLTD
jgi:hypothetical protein